MNLIDLRRSVLEDRELIRSGIDNLGKPCHCPSCEEARESLEKNEPLLEEMEARERLGL